MNTPCVYMFLLAIVCCLDDLKRKTVISPKSSMNAEGACDREEGRLLVAPEEV